MITIMTIATCPVLGASSKWSRRNHLFSSVMNEMRNRRSLIGHLSRRSVFRSGQVRLSHYFQVRVVVEVLFGWLVGWLSRWLVSIPFVTVVIVVVLLSSTPSLSFFFSFFFLLYTRVFLPRPPLPSPLPSFLYPSLHSTSFFAPFFSISFTYDPHPIVSPCARLLVLVTYHNFPPLSSCFLSFPFQSPPLALSTVATTPFFLLHPLSICSIILSSSLCKVSFIVDGLSHC